MIPFFSSELPSYLANAADDGLLEINKGIIKTPSFPELCTTNEMFRVLRNGQYTILHCSEEPARLASSMNVVIMRANIHAKAFYLPMLTYNNNNAPDCYSYDGLTPSLAAKKSRQISVLYARITS